MDYLGQPTAGVVITEEEFKDLEDERVASTLHRMDGSIHRVMDDGTTSFSTLWSSSKTAAEIALGGGGGGNTILQSTGLFTGGALTVNGGDTTKYDIADGTGQYVSGATVTPTSWSGLTANAGPYTGTLTYVSIAPGNVVTISPSKPTPTQRRNNIFLGVLGTVDLTNVNDTSSTPVYLGNELSQLNDLSESIGLINVSGNEISSNNLLTIAKSLGSIYNFGGNFQTSATNPSINTIAALDTNVADTFAYVYQDSSVVLSQTNLIPANYDDGNGAGAPGTVQSNDWATSRVYLNDVIMVIQPGQVVYNTLSTARSNLATESFQESPGVQTNGLLVGYIIIRGGATDLSNSGDALFVQAGKFGGNGSGSGTVDLQVAFDNSNIPQITTNATNAALELKSHSTSGDVLRVKDSTNTTTARIEADGWIHGDTLLIADDIGCQSVTLNDSGGAQKWQEYVVPGTFEKISVSTSTDYRTTNQDGSFEHSVGGVEAFVLNSNSQIQLGDCPPPNSTCKLSLCSTTNTELAMLEYGNSASPAALHMYKARNTSASPQIVQDADFLMSVKGYGYDGTSFQNAASMNVLTTQPWTGSANGAAYSFWTTANNQTAPRETMLLDQDGSLGIGPSADRYILPPGRGTNAEVLRAVNSSGDVQWIQLTPATTTDHSIARFNTTGVLDDSGVLIDDTDNMTGVETLSATELSADNVDVKDLNLKNDVGTNRWRLGHDQTTDDILLQNAVGADIQSIEQNGSIVHNISGSPAWGINANGQMTLGDFDAINSTAQLSISNPSNTEIALYEAADTASPAAIHMYKSRGTPQAPTDVIDGSFLASIKGYGWEGGVGGAFRQGTNFNIQCTQNWGASARGSNMVINTVTNNTTTPTVKFVFDHDGSLGIGPSADRYTLPGSRGTNGEVLRAVNSSGTVDWIQLTPSSTTATSLAKFNTTGVLSDSNWLLSASNDLTNIGGKLGLGTATPGSLLEVKDGATQILDVDDSTGVTVGVDFRYSKGLAEFYAEANATTTTVTVGGNWYPLQFASGASSTGQASGFTVDTVTNVGRITYTGSRNRITQIGSTVSFKSNVNNVQIEFKIYKNGVAVPGSHAIAFYGHGANTYASMSFHTMPTLALNDYIEIYCTSNTALTVLTVEEANIFTMNAPNV